MVKQIKLGFKELPRSLNFFNETLFKYNIVLYKCKTTFLTVCHQLSTISRKKDSSIRNERVDVLYLV